MEEVLAELSFFVLSPLTGLQIEHNIRHKRNKINRAFGITAVPSFGRLNTIV
jgi:hypothetical protein